jgi:hypothetical protein
MYQALGPWPLAENSETAVLAWWEFRMGTREGWPKKANVVLARAEKEKRKKNDKQMEDSSSPIESLLVRIISLCVTSTRAHATWQKSKSSWRENAEMGLAKSTLAEAV